MTAKHKSKLICPYSSRHPDRHQTEGRAPRVGSARTPRPRRLEWKLRQGAAARIPRHSQGLLRKTDKM